MKGSRENKTISSFDESRLRIFSSDSIGGVIVSICCATGLAFSFGNEEQFAFNNKVSWYVAFVLMAIVRILTSLYYEKACLKADFKPTKHLYLASTGILCIAILWALYPIFIIPSVSDPVELACIVMIYTSLSSGAVSVLSAFKYIATAYISALMLPLSIMLFMSPVNNAYVIAILSLAFYIIILVSAIRSATFTLESIKMRNENTDLITRLEEQNEQITQSKTMLEEKVLERTDEIFRLSHIDPLTNLFNRRAFSPQLESLIQSSSESKTTFSLLFIDLDGFKTINDIHGHDIGDSVLKTIASRLLSVHPGDCLLCRWGGDEFLATLNNTNKDEVQAYAEKLIVCLSKPIDSKVGALSVNATIGITLYPEHGKSESVLISNADIAMYHQKSQSKGSAYVFTEQIQQELSRTSFLKDALAVAIENNEFSLVYQPVVSAKNGIVLFSEALLRWSKNGEMISPAEFIEVAENHGYIQSIGIWVAEQVAKELNEIQEPSLCVSINMSVAQLMTNNIAEDFETIFKRNSILSSQIYIEVTESILTKDIELLVSNISRLNKLGFNIAVDDFGTGYSSLSQLQKITPKVIKIDKSFVDNWADGGEVIIQAVQDMSNKLSFEVVLEGVETKEQSENVKQAGIKFIQGFYYAKPMPIASLKHWLKK